LLSFVHPDLKTPKSVIKEWLDAIASASISAIFIDRNCKEWCTSFIDTYCSTLFL